MIKKSLKNFMKEFNISLNAPKNTIAIELNVKEKNNQKSNFVLK